MKFLRQRAAYCFCQFCGLGFDSDQRCEAARCVNRLYALCVCFSGGQPVAVPDTFRYLWLGSAAVLIPAAFPDPAAQRVIQVAAFQQCSTLLPAAVVRQTVLVIVVIMVAVATAVTVAVSQPRSL